MWFRLVDSEAFIKEFYDYADKLKRDGENTIREQEISRREKALEDHLENKKPTQEEIWEIRDPDAVF